MNKVYDFVTTKAWALHQPVYSSLVKVVTRHANGEKLDAEEIDQIVAVGREKRGERDAHAAPGGVAAIPVHGVLARYSKQVNGTSQPQGTSVNAIRKQLRAALDDDDIETIVLDVDSPGGSVHGIPELAKEIRAARDHKRVLAHVDGMAASAAYWLASQAESITATESSDIGSIGVYAQVVDDHRLYEAQGIDVKTVKAGKHKAVGAPGTPITAEDIATIQQGVDDFYDMFVDAVAQGRGFDTEQARDLGDGQTHVASRSLELQLIDQVGSFADVLESAGHENTTYERAAMATPQGEQEGEHVASPGHVSSTHEGQGMGTTEPAIDSVQALEGQYADLVASVRADATKKATEDERERCSRILRRATESQHELAATLINDGTDYPSALEQLVDDPRRNAAATAAERNAAAPPAVEPVDPQTIEAAQPDPFENPEQVWEADASVRQAWGGNKGYFLAAMRHADHAFVGSASLKQRVEG